MRNREGWEVKTLGEVCEIRSGRNQKQVEDSNGNYPIIGSGGLMGYANDFICPAGTVVLGRKGTINKPFLMSERFWNVDTAFGLIANDNYLNSNYLYYFCKSFDFYTLNVAVTLPSLRKIDLHRINISIPPLSTQHQIVAELDTLNSIIDKKKEQLNELDNLAQATFYDMFGDPVENEKGWEKVPFNKVMTLKRGYDLPIQDRIDGNVPIMASNGVLGSHNIHKVEGPGVVTGRSGTLGLVHYVQNDYWPLNTALYVQKMNGNNPIYLLYLLKTFDLKRFSRGAGVPTLNRNLVHAEKVIETPLPLQTQFAKKIKHIEQQKALIQRSIDDVQQLFDYTMDKYFN